MHARAITMMMYRNKVNDLKESIKKIQWEISNVRARRLARRYNGQARDEEEATESFRIKSMDAELMILEREEHFLLQELTRALETQNAHLTRHSICS
jgi:predicted ATP-grasp superfamily ATP-dependent carboligase